MNGDVVGRRTDTHTDILVQGKSALTGQWEILGTGDVSHARERYWREHATEGAFTEFRTVRRVVVTEVTTEVVE